MRLHAMQSVLRTVLFTLSFSAFAQDVPRGTEEEVKKMIDSALGYIREAGIEKAFAEFDDVKNKRWHYKDLYIFCSKMDGMTDCHGSNSALIGKNLYLMQSVDGQYFVRDSAEIVKKSGSGWLYYKRANPLNGVVEMKKVFVTKVPGYDGFIGSGFFQPFENQ